MIQATQTRSISAARAPISFALGMVAGLTEFAGGRYFSRLHPIRSVLRTCAADRGRFIDGYDFVADKAARL